MRSICKQVVRLGSVSEVHEYQTPKVAVHLAQTQAMIHATAKREPDKMRGCNEEAADQRGLSRDEVTRLRKVFICCL